MESKENAERDALITHYASYAKYVANRLVKTLGLPSELLDDFVSAGYVGLVEAAAKFDTKYNVDFRAYAYLRIRGSIIDSIKLDQGLNSKQLKAIQIFKELQAIRLENVNKVYRDEIREVYDLVAQGAILHKLQITEDIANRTVTLNVEDNPEEYLNRKESTRILRKAISRLCEREKKIIEEYYYTSKSLEEIGNEISGFTKSWISRLHAKALINLKKFYLDELYEK